VDPDEKPVAPKRFSAGERRLPPTPPPPGTPAFARRRRRRGRILAGILLLLLGLLLLGANSLFQPFKGEGGEEVTVRIPTNSTVADVGDLLAENEIVDSSFLFVIRARLAGTDLKAGTYRLKKDSSYGDALDTLDEDPAAPKTIQVVIPEGRSRQETAPLVKEAGVAGSYIKASARRKGFRPARYGAPRDTRTLEGFLFPATYELRPGDTASTLVGKQLDTFREQIAEVDMRRARQRNLDVYDVLIIASMVEREAGIAKERPLIAAVIYNRLRAGMPLQIDATTRYAVRNWDSPLKQSELDSDSPYNTRNRTGLPPGPIGSAGLDSIRAAAVDSSFLFVIRARLAGTDLKAGTYRLKKDSSYGDALDTLDEDPAAPKTIQVVIPEGRSRQETAPLVKEAGVAGSYIKGQRPPQGLPPRALRRAARHQDAGGIPLPGHLRAAAGRHGEHARRQAARHVPRADRRGRHAPRAPAQPRRLRRADHRLDGRARGRHRQGAPAHRRRHPQPPAPGMPLRSTRRSATPCATGSAPLKESELDSTRRTTRAPDRPAAAPIGSPGLDSIRAAANPGERRLPLLRRQAVRRRWHTLLRDRPEFAARQSRVQPRARERAASRPPSADGPHGASSPAPNRGHRPRGRRSG
jgi:uncharacterized YceG family protein